MKEIIVKTNKRIDFFDALKGFAIFLVILGHTIQYSYSCFDKIFLFKIIYGMHMPLFFIISGFFAYNNKREIDFKWLTNKFIQLFIPTVFWRVVNYYIENNNGSKNLISYLHLSFKNNNGVWFLYSLFLCCALLYLGSQILRYVKIKDYIIFPLLILGVWVIFFVFNYGHYGLSGLGYYSIYYFSGFFLSKYSGTKIKDYFTDKNKIPLIKRLIYLLAFISLYVLLLVFWRRNEKAVFLSPFVESSITVLINYAYKYLTAFVGIVATALLIKEVSLYFKYTNKVLCYLGIRSLEIYVLHILVVERFAKIRGGGMCALLFSFFGSLAFSLILEWIINRNKVKTILFGKK